MLEKYDQFIFKLNETTNPLNNEIANLPLLGLHILNQVQVWHWQTSNNSEHEVLGKFYNEFYELNDQLTEVIMGKYNKISVQNHIPLELQDIKEVILETWFDDLIDTYQTIKDEQFDDSDEIENIIDDITTSIEQLKYLLRQQ